MPRANQLFPVPGFKWRYVTINTKALVINTKQSSVGMNDYNGMLECFIMLSISVNLAIKGMYTYIGVMLFIIDIFGTIY